MQLWIMAQNGRRLIPVNRDIFIQGNCIMYDDYDDEIVLGEYDDILIAKHVLNDILSCLMPSVKLLGNKDLLGNDAQFYGIENISSFVYVMPEKNITIKGDE